MRKRNNIQKKFFKEKFSHNQYWVLHYTERYKDKSERDFKVFLKARSSKLALEILDLKLSEDPNFFKRKTSRIYMLHKDYHKDVVGKNKIKFWNSVRRVAFPNEFDKLFKIEKKRLPGQIGRQNYSPAKNYVKPKDELDRFVEAGKEYNKKKTRNWFKPVSKYGKSKMDGRGMLNYNDKKNAKKELEFIIEVMDKTEGNVNYASDLLGISHKTLIMRLKFFKNINWKKKYPNPPWREAVYDPEKVKEGRIKALETRRKNGTLVPKNILDPKVQKQMAISRKKNYAKKRKARLTEMKPKLEKILLKHNHLLKDAAYEMGISRDSLRKVMVQMGDIFPEFKKEFLDNVNNIRLAHRLEGKKAKRIKYLKSIKNNILEAYYQNNKVYRQAAAHLNMPVSTYMRAFKNIHKYEV